MKPAVVRLARRSTLSHIRHVAPVLPEAAPELVRRVYEQVERDFGLLAPPIALHAAAPGVLSAAWCILRETLLVPGSTSRRERESVAAAVSAANGCPYCVEVHQAVVRGLGGRGDPPPPAVLSPELIGVAVTFHYINRMVNVFLQDSPLTAVPVPLRARARSVAARLMGRLAGRPAAAGQSLPLLPTTAGAGQGLPADLRWAAGRPHVAAAMTASAAVIAEAGHRTVPSPVRELVRECLAGGFALPRELADGSGALESRLGALSHSDRPAGRLAMLVAFASYRVPGSLVARVRAAGHDDAGLIELTAWAALAAARRRGDELTAALEASGSAI